MNKSNEYDIRSCVIKELLRNGFSREDIRIEIPMSTASSTGRADIVCLGKDYAACIELKSGKDKFCSDALKRQMQPYRLVFDYCSVIADIEHWRETTIQNKSGKRIFDNFRCVDLHYYHDSFREMGRISKCKYGAESLSDALFARHKRNKAISVYHMASVLWADELKDIFSNKSPKYKNEIFARENMGTAEFRPIFIDALRKRPLNEWETKFWNKFEESRGES